MARLRPEVTAFLAGGLVDFVQNNDTNHRCAVGLEDERQDTVIADRGGGIDLRASKDGRTRGG